ncbi:hypothetical protein CB1_001451036 [Camelus ferus]|nr:hypothetical protein CB1_001451036 [Camelus ferus]
MARPRQPPAPLSQSPSPASQEGDLVLEIWQHSPKANSLQHNCFSTSSGTGQAPRVGAAAGTVRSDSAAWAGPRSCRHARRPRRQQAPPVAEGTSACCCHPAHATSAPEIHRREERKVTGQSRISRLRRALPCSFPPGLHRQRALALLSRGTRPAPPPDLPSERMRFTINPGRSPRGSVLTHQDVNREETTQGKRKKSATSPLLQ